MRLVPVLFIATILIAGVLGALVAALYSEPMNRFLRSRGSRRGPLQSLAEPQNIVPSET